MSRLPNPPPDSTANPAAATAPDKHHLIGQSFYVYTRVRVAVAVAMVAAAFFAHYVLRMEALDVGRLTTLALFIALYDLAAWLFFRRHTGPDIPASVYPRLLAVTYAAVILDFLSLTAAVWLVGGGRSPFTAFYLLHVMVSCILLSRRAALTLTTLAWGLLVSMIVIEWTGAAIPPLPAGAVTGEGRLTGIQAVTLIVVSGTLLLLSALLLLGLTGALRRVERRILLANAELSRLSQLRKDFLHIGAHNLRAPLGAVTMLLENMRAGLAGEVTEKQKDWLGRSLRRLGDLSEFMTEMQTLSALETDIIKSEFKAVDLAGIVGRLVEEYRDVAEGRRHSLTLEPPGPVPPVLGHDRLLREAVVNYITNAIKYTPEGGTIVVRVLHRASWVRVEVSDNGPGIPREEQWRLFREFVRLEGPGMEANRVKGSGLGLSIVRRVMEAHGGRVGVESEAGEGSTFFLELPALVE